MNLNKVLVYLLVVAVSNFTVSATGGIFHVVHKFAGRQRSLSTIKEHDAHRHQRMLSAVALPLVGDQGLYYTKLEIGSPPKDYYVHVDSGSNIVWVNCINCESCQKKSDLGVKLTLYDPSSSAGSEVISCDHDFCSLIGQEATDCEADTRCEYVTTYGDGSQTSGYFVRDVIQYDRVSGNLQTTPANSSVVLGCVLEQSENFTTSDVALDGIIGFGQSSLSMMSQMAAAGTMKEMFGHCLDGNNGGGIFAMGNIVKPKVKTTPLVANKTDYNINLEEIKVGKDVLQLSEGVLGAENRMETTMDFSTVLAYLPDEIYEPLAKKILANHSDLKIETYEETYQCFKFNRSLDSAFPTVTLSFEDSLQLVVYPHEYLFEIEVGEYCIGWQSSGSGGTAHLGDLVLRNKLVVYDIENQSLGWTTYNCSSTIEVKDDQSNAVYKVGALDISASFARKQDMGCVISLLLLCTLFHTLIYTVHYT